jgi:DNA-binding IclR family transcriptional regulator
MTLTQLEHVPHVQAGEVIGELGRIIVCVPDDSDVAAVWAVAGPAVAAAHLGPVALREMAALLVEAADALRKETLQEDAPL